MKVIRMLVLTIPMVVVTQINTWEHIGPEGGRITAITQDPRNSSTMYVIPYGYPTKILKSSTHGQQWAQVGSINDYLTGIVVDPHASTNLYAYSQSRLYRSINDGQSWASTTVPSGCYLYDIYPDPKTPGTLHASGYHYIAGSTYRSMVLYLKSTNNGASWSTTDIQLTTVYTEGYGRSITIDSSDNQTILIGGYIVVLSGTSYYGYGKLLRSTDNGATFTDLTPSGSGYFYDVIFDRKIPGRAFAATSAGIYRTTNNGTTWLRNNGVVINCFYLALDRVNPNNLAAQSAITIFRSTDGGVNWLPSTASGAGCSGIVMEDSPSENVFYSNDAGVFRSSNRGVTWEFCNHGISAASITSLHVTPTTTPVLYAGFQYNTVYKTTGATAPSVSWQMLNRFYTCTNINAIQSLPEDPNRLYALEGGG